MDRKTVGFNSKSGALYNLTLTAMLCAVSVVLSALESMVELLPFMIPGMKLGLSNVAVMFSLELCSLPSALCVVLFKAVFALVTRGGVAFLMSLSGGILSTLVMYLFIISEKPRFGYIGVGISGAVFHNTGQLFVAFFLVGEGVVAYAVFLLLISLVTGSLTALINYLTLPFIRKIPAAGGRDKEDI